MYLKHTIKCGWMKWREIIIDSGQMRENRL
jgi:hypothetical protein